MKSVFTNTIIILLVTFTSANACDFCNYYVGLNPGYNKNTVGIRSNYRTASHMITGNPTLKIMHGDDDHGSSSADEEMTASFLSFDLFARFYPISKLQLLASLPYQLNTISFMDKEESRNSISDLTLMAMYQVANTMAMDSNKVRHRVFAGAGVKLPTGKSSGTSDVNIPMSHHLNTGTGSTDFLFAASYIGKFKKFGWNTDVSFKLNGESKNNYRYGNTFNVTPRIFYETGLKTLKIFPHIGAAYEFGNNDYYEDFKQQETGGTVYWGSAGVDVYFSRFSVTTDVRIPVHQDLASTVLEDKYWLFGSFNIHF